ncbi:MAG: hypothetical protein K9J72_11055 [Synechococcus sp. Tobar2m-G35]|jgi:hypothetical protein|nr:hypothetical protein [Synechococcus sp. Tobar2m-G35]
MKSLLVHIGTGKTGSTAIQHALTTSGSVLREKGVHYWGLNLEGCDAAARLHPWQEPSGTGAIQKLSVPDAIQQLRQVLDKALTALPDSQLAIWSNESICERPAVYLPVIKDASEAAGVSCTVVCYVRSHRAFVNSAYKQWGVKHKTYAGRVLGFRDWIRSRGQFLSYGRQVAAWDAAFADRLRLVNYDQVPDVVQHFAGFLPDPSLLTVPKRRMNVAPAQSLLALYALHNNQLDAAVPPQAVETLLQRYPLAGAKHEVTDLAALFPDGQALSEAEELLKDDADLVNGLLRRHGQPELLSGNQGDDDPALTTNDVQSSLLSVLLQMLMLQEKRISQLEKQLAGGNPA